MVGIKQTLPKVSRRSVSQVIKDFKGQFSAWWNGYTEDRLVKCPCKDCNRLYWPNPDWGHYDMCDLCRADYVKYHKRQPHRNLHPSTPFKILREIEEHMSEYHKLPVGKTFPEKPEYVWELEALKKARLEEELSSKFHPDAKKALRRFWSMP